MNEQKKNILRIVLQTLISVISAVATALGLQSCMYARHDDGCRDAARTVSGALLPSVVQLFTV